MTVFPSGGLVLLETIFVTFSFSSFYFPCSSKLALWKNYQYYVRLTYNSQSCKYLLMFDFEQSSIYRNNNHIG